MHFFKDKVEVMTGNILVFCTCGSVEEAQLVARTLVERRHAACVNLLPGVHSIYRWEGKVEEGVEVQLLIKTQASRYSDVEHTICEVHSYSTPEIIAVPIEKGSLAYLDWILGETSSLQ